MRPLRTSVLFAAVAVVAASRAVPGQAPIQAVSAGVSVQVGPTAPAMVASGVDVSAGVLRSVNNSVGSGLFRAEHLATTSAIDLIWTVSAAAQNPGTSRSQGELRCELRAPEPVAGQLTVTWTPVATGTGSTAFTCDLFDDGFDVVSTTTTWSVWLGPSPLPLRVHAQSLASAGTYSGPWGSLWHYSGTASGTLRIRFEPTHCTAVAFGPGCAGPQLQVVGNLSGGADLRGVFAPGTDLGIAVLGLDQQALPLPMAPGCSLVTTPLVVWWSAMGPQSVLQWSIGLPAAVRPLGFAAQLVGLDLAALTARTSSGYWLTCQ